jgi:hypothetical protein
MMGPFLLLPAWRVTLGPPKVCLLATYEALAFPGPFSLISRLFPVEKNVINFSGPTIEVSYLEDGDGIVVLGIDGAGFGGSVLL